MIEHLLKKLPEGDHMTSAVQFTASDQTYGGIFTDNGADRTVLVLPDWRGGHTDYAARRGAELGRVLGQNVIVSDLYGLDYRPKAYAGDAEVWISQALSDRLILRGRLAAYLEALAAALGTPPDKVSVVGYCLGGALAFEMGRADVNLSHVVSIHGIPSTPQPIDRIQSATEFLAIHGADDPIIGLDELLLFQQEMSRAEIPWLSLAIGHTLHGYTDEDGDPNGMHQRYDPSAARHSLNAVQFFLHGD